jgi:hypothetical protein
MKKNPTVDQNLSALCIVMMLGPRSPLYRTLLSRLLPFVSKNYQMHYAFKFTNLTMVHMSVMHFSLFQSSFFQREDMLVRVGIIDPCLAVVQKKSKNPF